MLCAAPDITKPTGLRAARPGPSIKPSFRPSPSNQTPSSSTGISRAQHGYPSTSIPNGTPAPSARPPPRPPAKAAAMLYRQQPPLLPSHTSQLTASLKGNTKGKRKGWPPSGTKPTWQQQMVTAANRSAEEGSSNQAVGQASEAAPWSTHRGFTPSPLQAVSAASQQREAGTHLQPFAQEPAVTSESPSHRHGGSHQSGLSINTCQGLHQAAPQASDPSRPSYASKVAASSRIEPAGSLSGAPGKHPERPHVGDSEQKDSRCKQQNGSGRGSGKKRPPMVAAPAASGEASAGPNVQASRPVATASAAQQQSPFSSQKSISFGREAATATASAAAATGANEVQADLYQPSKQTAQGPSASSSEKAQPPFAVHTSSSQQEQQQHPPFREPGTTSGSQGAACTGAAHLPHRDADSSLETENRDPKMTQKEAKAAAGHRAAVQQKAAVASQNLLASPFNMPTLDTLPSFTKPLPASKYKEFPSSRSSHTAAEPSAEPSAQSSSPQVPDQARPASPDAQSPAHRAESSQRATAPPDAIDTTESGTALAPSSPGSTPSAAAHSPGRQGQTPWDKDQGLASPRTPLPMPEVSQSELSFKPSSSTSGPMASCSHSDSGFSLLWDDDPFWQVSACCMSSNRLQIAVKSLSVAEGMTGKWVWYCIDSGMTATMFTAYGHTTSVVPVILLLCNIQRYKCSEACVLAM